MGQRKVQVGKIFPCEQSRLRTRLLFFATKQGEQDEADKQRDGR